MKKPFAKFIDKLEGNLPPEGIECIPKGRTPDLHYSGTITGSREDEEEHYDEVDRSIRSRQNTGVRYSLDRDDEDYEEDDEDYEEDYEEDDEDELITIRVGHNLC